MKNKLKFLAITIILLLTLLSCTTQGSNIGDVMTTLIGPGNLKYYIRPSKMISKNASYDKVYLEIDFSYQMKNQNYVSDAYTNFSVYYKDVDFVEDAHFILDSLDDIDSDDVSLFEIITLGRDTKRGYIRVGTILKKDDIKTVLTNLSNKKAKLKIILSNNKVLVFEPTDELINKINTAFER